MLSFRCALVLLLLPVLANAQNRKAGLWDVTTNMTWQQSPFPAGMPMPNAGPQTTQVCLTQQQVDKYNGILPQTRYDCQITNLVKNPKGMTADMVCTGRMNGKATVESTATDSEHAIGKVHFNGTVQAGPNARPVEWTVLSNSAFKSADCGSVKPVEPPVK